MTMNTRIHIADPVNPERLFFLLLDALTADPAFVPTWEQLGNDNPFKPEPGPLQRGRATYKHVQAGDVMYHRKDNGKPVLEDDNEYRSTLGQGLGALVEVTYAVDGPIVWPPYKDDKYGIIPPPMREHLVSANFDTAYGYRDANDASCADLHAFLLSLIRDHLDEREQAPVKWIWHHEERGTWHHPDDITERGDPTKPVIANIHT